MRRMQPGCVESTAQKGAHNARNFRTKRGIAQCVLGGFARLAFTQKNGEMAPTTVDEKQPPEATEVDAEDLQVGGDKNGREDGKNMTKQCEETRDMLIRLKELSRDKLPNMITFTPHRMKNIFARISCTQINDLAALMPCG